MGVTGLWQIVQPCARPIKIETLNRRRLAVDASIWIYQFLKAVRDKEGNALRNSHVVGFFRRICKLLFFGIKPVFVFDGGAPALKRATIAARKSRREGRREDAARTAGKLLAVQMQRAAEQEEERRRRAAHPREQVEEEVPDAEDGQAAYVDEIFMTDKERRANRKFRKTDAYHLPELDVSLNEMGGASDPRIMSLEELEAYARQFESGEDINVYDFSKIDYDGPFFMSLPASDRYNILNAARLRSRLRMGHSKEQLDSMFPDRMEFSKFQIERVRERNELTQRLMNLNGFQDGMDFSGRVAGEKGREYVLVKNDGVEGGWALGVISDEGKQEKPIDVDKPAPIVQVEPEEEWDDQGDFEDVPIEGLNRLPKLSPAHPSANTELAQRRKALYKSRRQATRRRPKRKAPQDPNSLFVQSEDEAEEEWEDVDANNDSVEHGSPEAVEDEELQRAIAMSLEKEGVTEEQLDRPSPAASDEEDDMLEVFQQSAVAEQQPLPKGSGRAIANIVNKRAFKAAPESREVTSFGVPTMKSDDSDEDSMDFQAALAESRRTKRQISPRRPVPPTPKKKADTVRNIAKEAGFSGPLPFESLDLGSSLLGKKKMQQRTEEASGGFENPAVAEKPQRTVEPLPPWFAGDIEKDIKAQKAIEDEDRERAKEFHRQFQFQDRGAALRRNQTDEVIDLEAEEINVGFRKGEVIDLDANDDSGLSQKEVMIAPPIDDAIRMGDMADKIRAEPPTPEAGQAANVPATESISDDEKASSSLNDASMQMTEPENKLARDKVRTNGDEELEWSESDDDRPKPSNETTSPIQAKAPHVAVEHRSRSPSEEFEDVTIPDAPAEQQFTPAHSPEADLDGPVPASGLAAQNALQEADEFDDFSDPEEEEMLRALTLEAEEHARFASSLNNRTQAQNIEEYERELKKLRTQQKKDRRDADEVTHIMITECQQLLRLFGLPYITAPMEAEAQCAELVSSGLVDGIVTDDSDCFLFGGTRIYKNMFNQAKFVECYLTSDLEKEFDLTREKLISIAQLLGSDYTEGVPGVGPVTALEILGEFATLDDFRDWWGGVQTNQIPKSADAEHAFRRKFRRNAARLFLPSAFPDPRVALAYRQPDVDRDPEPFQWGVPDLAALRSFLMATIGWSEERTDEVLVPVIRDMNRRLDEGTQANITAFFDGGVGVGAAQKGDGFAPRKKAAGSKRMGTALNRMAERAKMNRIGATAGEEGGVEGTARANPGESAKRRRTMRDNATLEHAVEDASDEISNGRGSEDEPPGKKRQKKTKSTRGRKSRRQVASSDE